MALRMRRPETVRLPLADDDWIVVKKHLTAGERRQMFADMLRYGVDGDEKVDRLKVGLSKIVAYLLDWSGVDADGKPIDITGKSPSELTSIVNDLPPEAFSDILTAVVEHDAAMDASREKEKNAPAGESASSATSPSPDSSAGATSGSPN